MLKEDFWSDVLLEVIKTLLSVVLLFISWQVGQRIIAYWDYRKKRNEIDIDSAHRFFGLYGEFRAINRLWNIFCFNTLHELKEQASARGSKLITIPDSNNVRWELIKRAADAESGIESLILKLTAERRLDRKEMEALGRFRQAYQKLRESIRADRPLRWSHATKEYEVFNDLATRFARMISLDEARKLELMPLDSDPEHTLEQALEGMRTITGYRPEQFDDYLKLATAEKRRAEATAGEPGGGG